MVAQGGQTISPDTGKEHMELIDTHCHIDVSSFFVDYKQVLARARSGGVTTMILPGVVRDGWDRLLSLCMQDEGLFAAPGLHPMYLSWHRPRHLEELEQLAQTVNLTAIGEIGLDYHVEGVDRQGQQHLFEAQIDIAATAHLPVLLHVRKAHDQVLATLRRKNFRYGGIVHAFSGSYQQACQYIKLGFVIGLCGTLTYDRARRIRAIASELPQEAVVLETDSPDIPLVNHRGERNLPEYLPEILEILAELRNDPCGDVARYTTANARRVLGLA